MLCRYLLTAGWLFPIFVLLLFVIKGQHYDPTVFMPSSSPISAMPVPSKVGEWVLENGLVLPSDRMFEKINGKADYYLQYGAVELSCGEWVMNDQRWDMYLYRFETQQGAGGAYSGEKPSNGVPLKSFNGHTVPGQVAITVDKYYLQLNALTAAADTGPSGDLAMALASGLGELAADSASVAPISLMELAGDDMVGDAEGYLPENAFGFSALNDVRTVDVALGDANAVWFAMPGDAETISAYVKELSMYSGDNHFTADGASGGSMFGSWGIAGEKNGAVWGVQNASSRKNLMLHWNALSQRLEKGSQKP